MRAKDTTKLPVKVQRRLNLLLLADFLDTPRRRLHFGMACFDLEDPKKCRTVACACGHGPLAGIPMTRSERQWGDWGDYADRVFIGRNNVELFEWLFDAEWDSVDNTRQGAAARIRYYLKHGIPDDADDQLYNGAPLCYRKGGKVLPEFAHKAGVWV